MDLSSLLVPLLIAAAAVVYGITSGRATASRLRQLQRDLEERKPRGFAVVAGVLVIVVVVALYN